ncbi:class I SAM-dependent methyltransferase [Flavobacterium jejuense]|uniref:Class I SAM-dependent methyltransferase n=1 Tax=Flavobacterium jejuense TaxID=1544455 RepID=A0ABX0IQR4_9FLAO|nr:class I SAM-dependent methyltransferase [Flavobacterium jejuense]NHN26165.1 class I SAM-dependent methyltransferase [Flavobacterium jejuense]
MKYKLKKIKAIYQLGKDTMSNSFHIDALNKNILEKKKGPIRTDVINYLVKQFDRDIHYLEIGVRYPEHNFNKINATYKYSVDPGVENQENPVEFKLTSDAFFKSIREGQILNSTIKFDIIFIDGLHLADQVEKDIINSLEFLNDDGFVILHDCNPPTEFHARESYNYFLSPAKGAWNGTTWKAFFKFRLVKEYYSCCIDSDWGIGIISKKINLGVSSKIHNPYFEYQIFNDTRKESLNLMSFEEFQAKVETKSN